MKYTLSDIKNSYPEAKAKIEPFWGKVFVRRTSFIFTVPFINLGWSANSVSLLSCIVAIVGSLLLCVNSIYAIWIGAIMLNLWSVLDCVDGNIARTKGESSLVGEFFDAMGGYCICAFSLVGVGMAAYHTTSIFPNDYAIYLILLGCVGSICDIFGRLIFQKYSNNVMRLERDKGNLANYKTEHESKESASKIKRLSMFIDYEFGTGGDELMFLLIAVAFKIIDIFLLLYSLYHIAGFIIIFTMYTRKMMRYDSNRKENIK